MPPEETSQENLPPEPVVEPPAAEAPIEPAPEVVPPPQETPNTVTITEVMGPPKSSQKNLWGKFLNKLNERKRKRLDKIMEVLGSSKQITNDDVEKILHVSNATAERYLNTLEKEGKLKQVGKTGKYTYYERIS